MDKRMGDATELQKRCAEASSSLPSHQSPDPSPRDLRTMYSYTAPHLSPAFFPVSNSPSPGGGSMRLLLRILCTSSPTPPPNNLVSKPVNPISHIRLPLPLPAPDLSAEMKEKIISLELMGLDSGRLLCKNPDLREASLGSIHQILYYLQSKGIRQKYLVRILEMCPTIITADIKKDLAPVFDFLSKDLEVPDKYFYKVIKRCPRILASSVRDQLKPALLYLHRLGLKDKPTLAFRDAILLVLNVEKTMIPKLEFLKSLGFSREEVVLMVNRTPDLLTFSIEKNFKPKAGYYFDDMRGSLDELKEFPQYFAHSLEQRIKPRHRELVERGIEMPLAVMLKSMDIEFRKLVKQLERDRQNGTSVSVQCT